MKFCANCFQDAEIIKIINSSVEIGTCPICGKENVPLYDTLKDNSISDYFDRLTDIYTNESELPDYVPKDSITTVSEDIIKNWKIFSKLLSDEKIKTILLELCKNKVLINQNFINERVSITQKYDKDKLKSYCIVNDGKWENFANIIKKENRFHSNKINLNVLEEFINILKLSYKKSENKKFYRGRISLDGGGFSDKKDLGAPPAKDTKSGRANSTGISRLYIADSIDTALYEIRASMYDHVTIGTFVLTKDIDVIDLTKINSISPFSLEEEDVSFFAMNREILNRIDEEISKPVRNNESPNEYVPTQYIVDFIKSLGKYQGIKYRSSMKPDDGYNIVIFNPSIFECIDLQNIEVKNIQYDYQ